MKTISVPEGLQTKTFVLESGAIQSLAELLKTKFPGKQPWIIADENTWQAAGKKGATLLREAGLNCAEPFIFPGEPRLHPDYNYSKMLAEKIPENGILVAIGSGVINDLAKCASGIKGIPYCCVPTACSVDGYTSAGAALSVNGTKKTVKCPAPCAVCADVDILATAPPEMLASGYADLLTKIPAGADWIIADTIGEEPINKDVWQFVQGPIRKWVSDNTDMLNIFHGLAVTGYGMQMYHESRPASGAEHLFSHVWEMEGLQQNGIDISHGFKVGVGLLASTLLMEYIIKHRFDEVRSRMKEGLTVEERRVE
ncbi:MAG: sn-glycerol-1-phosphate dehydrogenase, partial [Lentisphaeria bacterium]